MSYFFWILEEQSKKTNNNKIKFNDVAIPPQLADISFVVHKLAEMNKENFAEIADSVKKYSNAHKNNAIWIYNILFYFATIRRQLLQEFAEIFMICKKETNITPDIDNITYNDNTFAKILTLRDIDLYESDITSSLEELYQCYQPGTLEDIISNDDVEELKSKIEETNFNSKPIKIDGNDVTMLEFACYSGSVSCFRFLLQNHAEYNQDLAKWIGCGGNIEIFTDMESELQNNAILAIHSATKYHRYNLLNYLSKYVQKPELSLIVDSIQSMNIQMLAFLISNGGSFDNSHSNRYFPLHIAARTSLPELVNYVMENSSIPINQQDSTNDNSTALLESSLHGFTRVVVWLLERGADPHVSRKRDQMTPLHFAARNGDIKMVNALIEYKALPMPVSKKGKTPLHYAAEQGNKDMIVILTKNRPNINVTPEGKETPLDIAVRKADSNIVSALLARGIDPNPVHDKIMPPLYVAVKENMESIVAMLVMAGAGVNTCAVDGRKTRSPLHVACSKGYVDLARFLIENHADKNMRDSDGKKPVELSKKKEIQALFIE